MERLCSLGLELMGETDLTETVNFMTIELFNFYKPQVLLLGAFVVMINRGL